MKDRGNAALGPAGRLALVHAIMSGTSRWPQPIAGGTAGAGRGRRSAASADV
jgi:hypothetical protein